jgi:hypothetical protein
MSPELDPRLRGDDEEYAYRSACAGMTVGKLKTLQLPE